MKKPKHIALYEQSIALLRRGQRRRAREGLRASARAGPGFPAPLVALARDSLTSSEGSETEGKRALKEAKRLLLAAAAAAPNNPEALNELAYFLFVVDDRTAAAVRMFSKSADRALKLLEDAWVGEITALCELGRFRAAREIGERARVLFPASSRIARALGDIEPG